MDACDATVPEVGRAELVLSLGAAGAKPIPLRDDLSPAIQVETDTTKKSIRRAVRACFDAKQATQFYWAAS